jgi:hypothetical protein
VENLMAVSTEDVQALYQSLLGRQGAPEFVEQFTQYENLPAVYDAIYNSPEAINYRETGIPASVDNPGVLPTGDGTADGGNQGSQAVTAAQVQSLYQELLGRQGANENVTNWVNSGMSMDEIRSAIAGSPEGLNYAQYGIPASLDNPGVLPAPDGTASSGATSSGTAPPTNYSDQIAQYYQELFGRAPQPTGSEYWQSQLASGAISPDDLRQSLISGAQGLDRAYYEASQSGGPLFTATQELFGRAPVRGQYNEEQGRLMGGYDKYRPMYDEGLSDAEIRQQLLNAAYSRGEGGGRSADYQAYLDSLGISRENQPFLQEGGSYANVGYGADLSEYQQPSQGGAPMPGFPGGFPGSGGGGSPMPGGQYTPPSYGYRMPGQYITGNQLYSGLPYGMTQPMGKGGGMGGFGQGMTVPMQPFNYGYSSQYMPNRGLMSGYSTGFGPYGGYQRPMGGKGGMMRPRPRFGYGGKGGY